MYTEKDDQSPPPTLAVVSPLCSVYRWWMAPRDEAQGWAMIRNTWKLWPSLQAVSSRVPEVSKVIQDTGSLAWAWKWAISPSASLSSLTLNWNRDGDNITIHDVYRKRNKSYRKGDKSCKTKTIAVSTCSIKSNISHGKGNKSYRDRIKQSCVLQILCEFLL